MLKGVLNNVHVRGETVMSEYGEDHRCEATSCKSLEKFSTQGACTIPAKMPNNSNVFLSHTCAWIPSKLSPVATSVGHTSRKTLTVIGAVSPCAANMFCHDPSTHPTGFTKPRRSVHDTCTHTRKVPYVKIASWRGAMGTETKTPLAAHNQKR